jgi:hypothetical protein
MVNVGGFLRTCLPCSICFCWLLLHAKEKGEKSGRWDPLLWARVRCGGDGGGVSAHGVVGHRAKREREVKRER